MVITPATAVEPVPEEVTCTAIVSPGINETVAPSAENAPPFLLIAVLAEATAFNGPVKPLTVTVLEVVSVFTTAPVTEVKEMALGCLSAQVAPACGVAVPAAQS
jgi:hypothetical protein